MEYSDWWQSGNSAFLIFALLLMPLNIGTEILKWKILVSSAQPTSLRQAVKSYFAGIAISLITPNRIGEYPGRILFLKRKNTLRLVSVSVLGAFAQFIALFFTGMAGLIYYNIHFPGSWQKLILVFCVLMLLFSGFIFFRFEIIARKMERFKKLRRFQTYSYLMRRFTLREQFFILGLSLFRLCILALQYLVLLRWMQISLTAFTGIFLSALYFWAIAVVPSMALAELGIRGQ